MVKLDIVDTGNIVGKSVKKQNSRKVIPDETFAIDVEENTINCDDDDCILRYFVISGVVMFIGVVILLVLFV
uniref:Uncharacterized protein n=1 Tax=viral metagenome TaxID=1070528 RepID=A0A6C0EI52_9ZZZZ|tara:strand:+ start:539 stop:754 length:216 start_codon:yes stop_codon:yes gene_type:complete